MADDVTVDNGGLTDYVVATDDIGSGRQAQLVKLLYSADGVATAIGADANGLDVDVVRLPGQVTEDVAHSGGETLNGTAAKRTDTPASSAGTDGDWSTLNNDASGLLWIRQPPRHRTAQFSLVTQASAIAANDQLCDELELTSMALSAGGAGLIKNIVLTSNNTTQIAAEGWIYQLNPTPAGTNAVHDQTDANNKTARSIGYIDFSTWVTETSNIMSVGTFRGSPLCAGPGLPYQCNDGSNTTSLWIVMVTRTAVTPGATTDYYLEIAYEPGV